MSVNREYKSSVFTLLFEDKEKLIEVFNAIHNTDYPVDTEIEINTLKDVLYMNRMNDISFVIDGKFVVLIEHQSAVNYNMPLRLLMYIARIYEKILKDEDIYREKLIKIPTPEFIVFYNGNKEIPEEHILKLSDAFIEKGSIQMELTIKVININYDESKAIDKSKILSKSKTLHDYSYFVYTVKNYVSEKVGLDEAIKNAIHDCIKQNILKDFLEKHGSEVENMLYSEFNEELAKSVWRKEAMEEGRQEGRQEGRREGKEEGRQEGRQETKFEIAKSLLDILDVKTIADKTGLSIQEVEALAN